MKFNFRILLIACLASLLSRRGSPSMYLYYAIRTWNMGLIPSIKKVVSDVDKVTQRYKIGIVGYRWEKASSFYQSYDNRLFPNYKNRMSPVRDYPRYIVTKEVWRG